MVNYTTSLRIFFNPLWLGRFIRDPFSAEEIELQERWLQAAENEYSLYRVYLPELIAQLIRRDIPLSMKIRLSNIIRRCPGFGDQFSYKLQYQLLKDHPWSLLEEALGLESRSDWKFIIDLLRGKYLDAYQHDLDPSLKAAHHSMREEGIPQLIAMWIGETEKWDVHLTPLNEILSRCLRCGLDATVDELANKRIPFLSEKENHELLVWARGKFPDSHSLRTIVKLAVRERLVKLKYIVASEGQKFDGSYPHAVCNDPDVQAFLRGKEESFAIECKSYDFRQKIRSTYKWQVLCTCQFHIESTRNCKLDPAFSVKMRREESQLILTKSDAYFLLQQRLMDQRKEELAALILLSGSTKRVLPPILCPTKRICA